MDKQIDSINALVSAFESRNEQLHEEIKKNEEIIEEMKTELLNIQETQSTELNSDTKTKVAA